MLVCLLACMHACMHTYIHTYTHTYTHRHMHTHMHTYRQTRTLREASAGASPNSISLLQIMFTLGLMLASTLPERGRSV